MSFNTKLVSYFSINLINQSFQNNNNYTGKIDRKRFRDFLNDNFELTEEVIIDRIYKYFNTEAKDDIDLDEWVLGFNVILKGNNSEGNK